MPKIDTYSLDASLTDNDSLLGINAADGKTKRYAMSAIKTYVESVADISAVTAGTGLTGGGESGAVTLTVGAAQTTITSIFATDVKIGEDDETKIDFDTADTINFYAGNEKQLILTDGALTPGSNAIVDLGTDALEFKDAYFDGTVTTDVLTVGSTGITANGITEFDQWRVSTAFSGDAEPVASNWERPDTGNFEHIGTGMSQSSGIFTFPSTGKWWIQFAASFYYNGSSNYNHVYIRTTNDNSSYTNVAQGTTSTSDNARAGQAHITYLFDVTNTTTHKAQFYVTLEDNSTTVNADTNFNVVYASFIRIGDT